MAERNKQVKIQYKIIEIRKVSHFENDFKEFGFSEKELMPGNFEVTYGLNFPGDSNLEFKVNVIYSKIKEKKYKLFGIEAVYVFKIKYLEEKLKIKNGYKIPDKLMHTIVEMTMSGIRGMLSVLNTVALYKKIILQPVNIKEICQSLQKK